MTILRYEPGRETLPRGPWGKYRKIIRRLKRYAAQRCEVVRYGMTDDGHAVFYTGSVPRGVYPLASMQPPKACRR